MYRDKQPQPIPAVEDKQDSKTSLAPAKVNEVNRRKRLFILKSLAATGATMLGVGYLAYGQLADPNKPQLPEKPAGDNLLNQKITLQRGPEALYLTDKTASQFSQAVSINDPLDRGYLTELFSQLQTETSTPGLRKNQIINNLGLVVSPDARVTNGLMIDNSGIFLTCAHTFETISIDQDKSKPKDTKFRSLSRGLPAKVIYPPLRKTFTVLQYLANLETDLALFYAPTGYRRKRTDGIQINTQELKEGEDLVQPALSVTGQELYLHVISGSVVNRNDTSNNIDGFSKGLVSVADMIPFGGSSGAPIIDIDGRIVGVESGSYLKPGLDKANTRQDYAGSTISPLRSLRELILNGQLVDLPH